MIPTNERFFERIERRRERHVSPDLVQQGKLQRAINLLDTVVENKVPIESDGVSLYRDQLADLAGAISRSDEKTRAGRLKRYASRFPGSDPVERFLAGQMITLGLFNKPARAVHAARVLLTILPDAARTPAELVPEPAQKNEILSWDKLERTVDLLTKSDYADSVAQQLLDPLYLSLYGLRVKVVSQESPEESRDQGFTIPVALLDILKTLRFKESEKELQDWILVRCSTSEHDALNAIRLLYTLINFSSFLDSSAHLELWEPKARIPERGKEVLLQPFQSLLNSVNQARFWLTRAKAEKDILEVLENVETLIKLRYGEVYKGEFRTSLYTANIDAVTPSPQDFADLMEVFARRSVGQKRTDTAMAIVRLAESSGITDINPSIISLSFDPVLQEELIDEARRSGLLQDSKATYRAIQELRYDPFEDPLRVDFSKIIDKDATHIYLYFLTGTYGPPTNGHIDTIEKTISAINTLPKEDSQGKYQRLIIIAPVTNIENVPNYKKNPAEVGFVVDRVKALMLQLSGQHIDRKQVFITIAAQINPANTRSQETRVGGMQNLIMTKICKDTGRYDYVSRSYQVMGADEPEYVGSPRIIAPMSMQPNKVKSPGGILLSRWGYSLALIASHTALARETGIEHVVFRQDNPQYSSTMAKKQIAEGDATMVRAAARPLVLDVWSIRAIEERSQTLPSSETPDATEICKRLIRSG